MARTSLIEWTGATWNPITGCSIKSSGCTNCYAMELAATRLRHHPSRQGLTRQLPSGRYVWSGEVRFNEQWLNQPLQWKKPLIIFVCAHGDLFHEDVPTEWIDRVFGVIRQCPHHVFQVLTKRSERMLEYSLRQQTDRGLSGWPLPNVWFGVSIEDQKTYDERVLSLAATPASTRFISAEPLLGEINMGLLGIVPKTILPNFTPLHSCIDWVIVGGESGRHARPMHPDWARLIRDQCKEVGISFFFKQWGEWFPQCHWEDNPDLVLPDDSFAYRHNPENGVFHFEEPKGRLTAVMHRVGKAKAGRVLDGREWNEMPNFQQAE